jgi:hypothetical protein
MTNNFPTDALNSNGSEGVLDPIYLPFSAAILAKHFAPVGVSANPPEDYLRYYQESADRCRAFMLTVGKAFAPHCSSDSLPNRKGRAILDSRLLVTALLFIESD